jgi:uncharacterized membrane protein HdeD (DUF308 family)
VSDPNTLNPSSPDNAAARAAAARMATFWWVFLLSAVLWLVIAFVMFQFDTTSVSTLGYLVGFMLLFAGIGQFVAAGAVKGGWKVVWILFGLFFVAGGLWAIFNPWRSVANLALNLGFLLALVAIFWIIEAFATKAVNPLWWLGLVAGLLMLVVAFQAGNLDPLEKGRALIWLAGWWAILQAVGDFIRAFQLKKLGSLIGATDTA